MVTPPALPAVPGRHFGHLAQELEHRSGDAFEVVHERPVAAVVEHDDPGTWEGLALALGLLGWDVGVVSAPHNQGGAVQRTQRGRQHPGRLATRVVVARYRARIARLVPASKSSYMR